MSKAKLHHFVPQFYLRQWCDADEKLWVYPIDGRPPFQANPRNFAAESNLYTPKPGAPHVADDTESWFSEWEGLFAREWPGIVDRADNPQTRKNIARFLGTLVARHPEERNAVGEMNRRLVEAVREVADEEQISIIVKDATVNVKASEIREFGRTDEASVRTDFIRLMPAMAKTIAEALFQRNWGIVFSEKRSFITSDHPVASVRGTSRKPTFGFATPGTLVFFPISPYRFLVIADEWEAPFMHYKVDDEKVFIRRVVQTADRFVFSDRKDMRVVKAIQKLKSSK